MQPGVVSNHDAVFAPHILFRSFLRSSAENLHWGQTENNKGIPFFHSDEIAMQLPTNKTVMHRNNPMCRDNGGEGEWEGLLVACFRLLREVSQKFESSSPFAPNCFQA